MEAMVMEGGMEMEEVMEMKEDMEMEEDMVMEEDMEMEVVVVHPVMATEGQKMSNLRMVQ